MFIAVTNQKGGVGKSTIAVHLAVWLHEAGLRVAFIDADRQGTATRWLPHVAPEVRIETIRDPDEIMERGRELIRQHHVVIADAPANLDDVTRAIVPLAHLPSLPSGTTVQKMESPHSAIKKNKNAQAVREGRPQALVIFNRLPPDDRHRLLREAREAQHCLGFPVARSTLRLRAAFADAPGQRTVVWRFGAAAQKATMEINQLIEEILEYVKLEKTKDRRDAQRRRASVSGKRRRSERVPRTPSDTARRRVGSG